MAQMNSNILSYESCKWYVKLWRQRWYLYAIFLHIKNFIDVDLWIDYLIDNQLESKDKRKLRISWKEIITHVELSKMYKFSSKTNYERED